MSSAADLHGKRGSSRSQPRQTAGVGGRSGRTTVTTRGSWGSVVSQENDSDDGDMERNEGEKYQEEGTLTTTAVTIIRNTQLSSSEKKKSKRQQQQVAAPLANSSRFFYCSDIEFKNFTLFRRTHRHHRSNENRLHDDTLVYGATGSIKSGRLTAIIGMMPTSSSSSSSRLELEQFQQQYNLAVGGGEKALHALQQSLLLQRKQDRAASVSHVQFLRAIAGVLGVAGSSGAIDQLKFLVQQRLCCCCGCCGGSGSGGCRRSGGSRDDQEQESALLSQYASGGASLNPTASSYSCLTDQSSRLGLEARQSEMSYMADADDTYVEDWQFNNDPYNAFYTPVGSLLQRRVTQLTVTNTNTSSSSSSHLAKHLRHAERNNNQDAEKRQSLDTASSLNSRHGHEATTTSPTDHTTPKKEPASGSSPHLSFSIATDKTPMSIYEYRNDVSLLTFAATATGNGAGATSGGADDSAVDSSHQQSHSSDTYLDSEGLTIRQTIQFHREMRGGGKRKHQHSKQRDSSKNGAKHQHHSGDDTHCEYIAWVLKCLNLGDDDDDDDSDEDGDGDGGDNAKNKNKKKKKTASGIHMSYRDAEDVDGPAVGISVTNYLFASDSATDTNNENGTTTTQLLDDQHSSYQRLLDRQQKNKKKSGAKKRKLKYTETTLVSSLSFYERRRLSIAKELSLEPEALFIEEPTADLPTHEARELLGMLSVIARYSHDVAIVITLTHPRAALLNAPTRPKKSIMTKNAATQRRKQHVLAQQRKLKNETNYHRQHPGDQIIATSPRFSIHQNRDEAAAAADRGASPDTNSPAFDTIYVDNEEDQLDFELDEYAGSDIADGSSSTSKQPPATVFAIDDVIAFIGRNQHQQTIIGGGEGASSHSSSSSSFSQHNTSGVLDVIPPPQPFCGERAVLCRILLEEVQAVRAYQENLCSNSSTSSSIQINHQSRPSTTDNNGIVTDCFEEDIILDIALGTMYRGGIGSSGGNSNSSPTIHQDASSASLSAAAFPPAAGRASTSSVSASHVFYESVLKRLALYQQEQEKKKEEEDAQSAQQQVAAQSALNISTTGGQKENVDSVEKDDDARSGTHGNNSAATQNNVQDTSSETNTAEPELLEKLSSYTSLASPRGSMATVIADGIIPQDYGKEEEEDDDEEEDLDLVAKSTTSLYRSFDDTLGDPEAALDLARAMTSHMAMFTPELTEEDEDEEGGTAATAGTTQVKGVANDTTESDDYDELHPMTSVLEFDGDVRRSASPTGGNGGAAVSVTAPVAANAARGRQSRVASMPIRLRNSSVGARASSRASRSRAVSVNGDSGFRTGTSRSGRRLHNNMSETAVVSPQLLRRLFVKSRNEQLHLYRSSSGAAFSRHQRSRDNGFDDCSEIGRRKSQSSLSSVTSACPFFFLETFRKLYVLTKFGFIKALNKWRFGRWFSQLLALLVPFLVLLPVTIGAFILLRDETNFYVEQNQIGVVFIAVAGCLIHAVSRADGYVDKIFRFHRHHFLLRYHGPALFALEHTVSSFFYRFSLWLFATVALITAEYIDKATAAISQQARFGIEPNVLVTIAFLCSLVSFVASTIVFAVASVSCLFDRTEAGSSEGSGGNRNTQMYSYLGRDDNNTLNNTNKRSKSSRGRAVIATSSSSSNNGGVASRSRLMQVILFLIIMINFTTAGVFINVDSFPLFLELLSYISLVRLGFEVALVEAFRYGPLEDVESQARIELLNFMGFATHGDLSNGTTSSSVLSLQAKNSIYVNILVVMIFGSLFTSYLCLKLRKYFSTV